MWEKIKKLRAKVVSEFETYFCCFVFFVFYPAPDVAKRGFLT